MGRGGRLEKKERARQCILLLSGHRLGGGEDAMNRPKKAASTLAKKKTFT